MILRDYQRDAIDCMWAHLTALDSNPCIVIPTGGGKSPVIAGIARDAIQQYSRARVLVLAHVRELVRQNAEKMLAYWPDAPVGIYSAGLGKRDRYQQIIFASIQSVHRRAMQMGAFDLILIDEAHRIPASGDGVYRSFIADCRKINPRVRIVGLTATPYRLGIGPVCGPHNILNTVCYEVGVRQLIGAGYLSDLVSKSGIARADLSGVHVRGGEYVTGELETAINTDNVVSAAVGEIVALCADRRAIIAFCATVKHAEHVSAEFARHGIEAPVVIGGTASSERAERVRRFCSGDLRALCTVNVLSEGFDAPHVDCVALMRPTKSAGLYYQQVGRGLRKSPGKDNCLVLDFAGNILEHGPVDQIRVVTPMARGAKSVLTKQPMKLCPACQSFVAIASPTCSSCGYEWPTRETKHDSTATLAPVLSAGTGASSPVREYVVDSVQYAVHHKAGGLPSMRVTYMCGLLSVREWICVEHVGFARMRAERWWFARSDGRLPPDTAEDAVSQANTLAVPARIRVRDNGGKSFPEVIGYEFDQCENESGNVGQHGQGDADYSEHSRSHMRDVYQL